MGHIVQNLVKIALNMTFWALFKHSHFKKYRSESIFWETMSPLSYLFGSVEGHLSGSYGPKIGPNYLIYNFWVHFIHSTSRKFKMDSFSGSTII